MKPPPGVVPNQEIKIPLFELIRPWDAGRPPIANPPQRDQHGREHIFIDSYSRPEEDRADFWWYIDRRLTSPNYLVLFKNEWVAIASKEGNFSLHQKGFDGIYESGAGVDHVLARILSLKRLAEKHFGSGWGDLHQKPVEYTWPERTA